MTDRIKGKIYLVGAGPGDADLITVRGAELLKTADCIIYDKLANESLLKFARPDAEIIHTPKRIGSGSFTQEQINNLVIEKATTDKTVVRLKGGDPCVFGRVAQELAALVDAGIEFEIVPGITAGIAVAAYAGIILTDRDYNSQVVFVTGREADKKQESNIDWQWLANFKGTIVFYMAMRTLDFIVEQLTKNGMKKQTPAAIITNVSLPTQKMIKAPLHLLTQRCRQYNLEPPAIIIIGFAAERDAKPNWFMSKPLFGKNIVVTRDEKGNADFAAKVVRRGANPIQFATIRIKPLTQKNRFLQTLSKITEYDWIVFTSAKGVELFFESLHTLQKDARVFASAKIAAIGAKTADKLNEFGLKADFLPTVFTSEELGKQLIGFTNLQGKKILLLRSQLASNELCELLTAVGAAVDNVALYDILTQKSQCIRLKEEIADGRVDWLTFASPSAAKGFFEQVEPDLVYSSNIKVASIGPVTTEQLKNLGVRVNLTAKEHTLDGLLTAIERTYL